jgi:cytochrome oxidase assembly protein ShyY1
MTKRLPIAATIIVAVTVAVMIGLGIWQLGRANENKQLLAQYEAASKLPPIAYPTAPFKGPLPLFRYATAFCQKVVGQRSAEGRNRAGEVGWARIVDCATGPEGPGMSVEVGWSKDPNAKVNWNGGPVSGVIVRDRIRRMRLVAATAPPGLQPAGLPSAEMGVLVSPSRNRFYALQWFSFAAIALIIYGIALRKRLREQPKP